MEDDEEFDEGGEVNEEHDDEGEAEEAAADLREAAKQSNYYSLGDEDGADPASIKERIEGVLEVLADFKNRRESNRSRSEYMEQLASDLTAYYGYLRELTDLFLSMFSPNECVEFMEASDRNRPLVIRANTLKARRKDLIDALQKRGVTLEPLPWSKVAIKVTESPVPVGATPEYLAGHYMLQAASSLCPVMALDPQPGDKVLDMSAAPGGKTSYIAQLIKNTGTVVANDLKRERHKSTVANLHRMGVRCACVCVQDGRRMTKTMSGFDRVLLDAPCSGLGIISRDQSVKLQRTVKDIQRNAHLQKELILAAIDCADHKSSGGIIVYSTCSVSTEENEQVIQYALGKRFVKLIDTGLPLGNPGYTRHMERRFHPSLSLTRRFYPHTHNMDGFYVAKLKKYAAGKRTSDDEEKDGEDEEDGQQESQGVENYADDAGEDDHEHEQDLLEDEVVVDYERDENAEEEEEEEIREVDEVKQPDVVRTSKDVFTYRKTAKRIPLSRLRMLLAAAGKRQADGSRVTKRAKKLKTG